MARGASVPSSWGQKAVQPPARSISITRMLPAHWSESRRDQASATASGENAGISKAEKADSPSVFSASKASTSAAGANSMVVTPLIVSRMWLPCQV